MGEYGQNRGQGMGASADADRAVVNGAGQAVSALRASVPSAGDWAVLDNWRFRVVRVERVTEQCAFVQDEPGLRSRRTWFEKLVCWGADRAAVERASAQLTSAKAECERRERDARVAFQKARERIASGIEARKGEDANAASSRSDKSPAPEGGDAQ